MVYRGSKHMGLGLRFLIVCGLHDVIVGWFWGSWSEKQTPYILLQQAKAIFS